MNDSLSTERRRRRRRRRRCCCNYYLFTDEWQVRVLKSWTCNPAHVIFALLKSASFNDHAASSTVSTDVASVAAAASSLTWPPGRRRLWWPLRVYACEDDNEADLSTSFPFQWSPRRRVIDDDTGVRRYDAFGSQPEIQRHVVTNSLIACVATAHLNTLSSFHYL